MELSSEVVVDYFLQTSLMVHQSSKHNQINPNSNTNNNHHPLRDRTRCEVSTSVFKTDDAATLRTSPNFALNEDFLFQRWLFTLARRSVLAMRCFSDLAADPARSEWTRMLQESQLAQQRAKMTNSLQNQKTASVSTTANQEQQILPSNQVASPASGGLWCRRRTIWRAAHEKSREELPQAIISALNNYEIAELQHFGAASHQIQQIDPSDVTLEDVVKTFEEMMSDCGVPSLG